jgi:hypothetical protein
VLSIFYRSLVKNKMLNYYKQPINFEHINNPNSGINGKVFNLNYSNVLQIDIPFIENQEEASMFSKEFDEMFSFIKGILSHVSKVLYIYNNREHLDKERQIKLENFFDNSWKNAHFSISSNSAVFLSPYLFTEQFIESKLGKKFKDRKPCVELFVRALQSQKTILENLTVIEQ